jgi:hypothetical protein
VTDTTPDEEQAPARVRPFADVLRDLNHGQIADDAAVLMQELVTSVRSQGKKGTFTLKIDVAPMKGNDRALLISASATSKPPSSEPVVAAFFSDDDGNLLRDDPRQMALPLREVPKPDHANTPDLREARK